MSKALEAEVAARIESVPTEQLLGALEWTLEYLNQLKKTLPEYQVRVVEEKFNLEQKAKKLSAFIGENPNFADFKPEYQEQLKVQNDLMWQYFEVLESRIAAFQNL